MAIGIAATSQRSAAQFEGHRRATAQALQRLGEGDDHAIAIPRRRDGHRANHSCRVCIGKLFGGKSQPPSNLLLVGGMNVGRHAKIDGADERRATVARDRKTLFVDELSPAAFDRLGGWLAPPG